jgi:phenylacetate-CoA ligase
MFEKMVKHLIFPLHEKLLGRKTYGYLHSLEKLQWAEYDELSALKFSKLKALLIHAQENIPFYGKQFKEFEFDPFALEGLEDLRKLPLLSKAEIRQNLDDMVWKACPGGLHRYNTGGSSGEPLVFYFDRRRQAYDKAARAMTHRWWGIDIGDKELYLWGSPLEITKQDRLKDLRDRFTNEHLISAFEISKDRVPEIVNTFRSFRPKCVFGYPSTIALFCHMAAQQGWRLDDLGIKVVFVTAEVLYEDQKEVISDFFGGVPVADCYGSREGGFISHQCREGKYHVMDPNYILEFINNGKPVKPGAEGEIVITHLDVWGMPLIRYRTGDMAKAEEVACACGRTFSTMSNIKGRTTDFVVTPDGRWQHGLSVIYVVRDIEGVDEFRIMQEDVDDIRVLLKVHEDLYPADGDERIMRGIRKRMGEDVRVAVQRVDTIERDASGKYRYVISRVAEKGF